MSQQPEAIPATIWVCPNRNFRETGRPCGHYYAAPGIGDLREKMNQKRNEEKGGHDVSHSRARCPNCETDRVPVQVRIPLP